VKGFQSIKNIK
jgi:serine/threonine protein kinase